MVMLYHVGLEIGQAVHEELRRFAKGDLAEAMMLGQELFKHEALEPLKLSLTSRSAELLSGSGTPLNVDCLRIHQSRKAIL